MKFVKKPIVVDAEQFFIAKKPWPAGVYLDSMYGHKVKTPEGIVNVSDGDWIVTGIKDEQYPVKPDIFDLTYTQMLDSAVGEGETKPSERYEIRTGKWGQYFFDTVKDCDLTLREVQDLLNLLDRPRVRKARLEIFEEIEEARQRRLAAVGSVP